MAVDFKGAHYPSGVILFAVHFYVSFAVSYRDLEEMLLERGVEVDHATLNRWVVKYAPLIGKVNSLILCVLLIEDEVLPAISSKTRSSKMASQSEL